MREVRFWEEVHFHFFFVLYEPFCMLRVLRKRTNEKFRLFLKIECDNDWFIIKRRDVAMTASPLGVYPIPGNIFQNVGKFK